MGLFLVCSSLLAIGCKRPDETLGDGIQPIEDLLFAAVTDSFQLVTSTEQIDSLRTDLFANVLVGNYVDEDFGLVKCRGIMQFSPDATIDSLPDNLEVFAVELKLAYQPEAYGNNAPMYFQVHQLTERIYLDSAYYNNQLPQRNLDNLILSGRETQVTRSEYASAISTGNIEYLTLQLKPTFGQFLLSGDSALTDFDSFADYFNGLVISSNTMDGRVVSFATINSSIQVYYRYPGENRLNIGSYTFKYSSSCEGYSVIEHNHYGSALQSLTAENPITRTDLAFLQGAGGTRVRIDLNDVLWMRELEHPIINKAELVVPFDADTKFAQLDSVNVVYEKSEGAFALTADYGRNAGGNFRKSPGYYRFNVTNHIQSILAGEIETTELLMVAGPRVAGLYNSLGIRRTLIHGPSFSDDHTLNTRLVITYSY
ncbi:MAG: DUF4270 family protein [Flavobacteriales bacterium]